MRSRNIKPGFFRNELLAECDPFARLLFAGLWCIADRSGRLEDRPRRIKAEVLPFDSCDIEALLGQLENHGFIRRYSVNGRQFIEIPKFTAHQNPHMREAPSAIPDNDSGKHSASTVLGTAKAMPSPADSLIPDSLIPDSNTFCLEPEKPPALGPADEVDSKSKTKKLNGHTNGSNGRTYRVELDSKLIQWNGLTHEDGDVWDAAFPAIDIHTELQKAAAWAVANPSQRKKNWHRFLFNWLSRAQERGNSNGRRQ